MYPKIFVNLPVKDLNKSVKFFTQLGFTFNPQFTDENATCMIVQKDYIFVMLLVEPFFKTFVKKDIADTKNTTEVLVTLALESKEKVDELVDKAIAAGGTQYRIDDQGFMYVRSFEDLDGHNWEVFWMDQSAVQN